MRIRFFVFFRAAALAAAVLAPLSAVAQPADDPVEQGPPQNRGPMTVERMHSGFLIAPDVKVTRVDRRTSELAGVYGGWLADDTFFIGGGGYWLVNGSHDRRMAYGGVVVQWLGGMDRPIGYSVKALLGGGEATLTDSITIQVPILPARGSTAPITYTTQIQQYPFKQQFAVAEPEASLLLRIGHNVHITLGAGYRFIGTGRWSVEAYRLRGATGSVGVQIGGGGS